MKKNIFQKQYISILEGKLKYRTGTINAPINRKSNSIIEREVNPNGADAITYYDVLAFFKDFTLVRFQLKTGRTHQLRVHSSYIGHPILGDSLYGKPSHFIQRQALHAYKVKFIHPISGKQILLKAEVPQDIIHVLQLSKGNY